MRIQKLCKWCGKTFTGRTDKISETCSFTCCARLRNSRKGWAGLALIHALRGKDHPNFRSTEVTCSNCGKNFLIIPAKKGLKNFCSRRCTGLAKRLNESNTYLHTTVSGKPHIGHRLFAEKIVGRKFLRREHVHHINGKIRDNRAANLIVLDDPQHKRVHSIQRRESRIVSAQEILQLFPSAIWIGTLTDPESCP